MTPTPEIDDATRSVVTAEAVELQKQVTLDGGVFGGHRYDTARESKILATLQPSA